MARHRSRDSQLLPPLLVRIIRAAQQSGTDGEGAGLSRVPNALREFGTLALWAVPVYGVFLANNEKVCQVVARVARERLGMDEARRELREALQPIEEFAQRDAIESAVNHVMSVSDEAYFYAGLAVGVTVTDMRSPG